MSKGLLVTAPDAHRTADLFVAVLIDLVTNA
jgi:hypothetical protein